MYWYRLNTHLGRMSIVGATVKNAELLPQHLLSDEKHTWINGNKAYIATTVANECVLGAALTGQADEVPFLTGLESLKKWTNENVKSEIGLAAILKLCSKGEEFTKAYIYPECYRTSNMVDRHMQFQDRFLFNCRYFHGHFSSAQSSVRAWALIHNFAPYCPQAQKRLECSSPFERLNGFVYHDNWLENMMISASLGGHHIY